MPEHEFTALKDRLKEFSFALNKIVVESGRMEPPVLGVGSTDPCNILLQQWHPEEIRLQRELVKWQSRVLQLVHDRVEELEQSFNNQLIAARREEFNEGLLHGHRRGREQVVRDTFQYSDFGKNLDAFLENIIDALQIPGSEVCKTMLEEFRAALHASKADRNTVVVFGSDN